MIYKKTITFLIVFILGNYAKAQNICGTVMYKEESNIALFFQTISVTEFNQEVAYTKYMHYKKAKAFLNGEYDTDELSPGEEIVDSLSDETGMLYVNNKETYFTETWWKPNMLVKEDGFAWEWKLLGATKKIGDFNCQNASIEFRGRTFIAWFTIDIPVPFGPYKFKGLPGLILEINDSEKLWYMKAIKINLKNSKKKCPISFNPKELKNPINIKAFLKKSDSLFVNDIKKEISKYPKGQSGIDIPRRCSRLYDGRMVEIYKKR